MKKIFCLIPILAIIMSFSGKDQVYIWFPKKIRVIENCEGKEVSIKFDLETDAKKKIRVHSFRFNRQNFTLIANGKKRSITDTLLVREKDPLQIEIKYKRSQTLEQGNIHFKTDENKYLGNNIRINHGEYDIDVDAVRDGGEQILSFAKSCNDSLIVHFPYGGTISGVSLYKDSTELDAPIKFVSYGIMDEKNYLKFSKEEKGRYYVRFAACHWGNEFWLTIK